MIYYDEYRRMSHKGRSSGGSEIIRETTRDLYRDVQDEVGEVLWHLRLGLAGNKERVSKWDVH